MAEGPIAAWLARYDGDVMRPPAAWPEPPVLPPPAQAAMAWVQGLCKSAARSRPWAVIGLSLNPAHSVPGSMAAMSTDPWVTLADAIALELDGTWPLLAAGSPWRQKAFRLRIKLREAMTRGPRSPDLPWDCGHLLGLDGAHGERAGARAAWRRFRPRRPTLLIAVRPDVHALRAAVDTFAASAAQQPHAFPHPVRLLVLDAPEALAVSRDMLHEASHF